MKLEVWHHIYPVIRRGLEEACRDEIYGLMRGYFGLATLLGVGRKTSL